MSLVDSRFRTCEGDAVGWLGSGDHRGAHIWEGGDGRAFCLGNAVMCDKGRDSSGHHRGHRNGRPGRLEIVQVEGHGRWWRWWCGLS